MLPAPSRRVRRPCLQRPALCVATPTRPNRNPDPMSKFQSRQERLMEEPDTYDPEYAARLSAGIVQAIAQAKAQLHAGSLPSSARNDVARARELHDLLLAQMIAAEPQTVPYLRGVCDAIGNNIDDLERRLADAGHDVKG